MTLWATNNVIRVSIGSGLGANRLYIARTHHLVGHVAAGRRESANCDSRVAERVLAPHFGRRRRLQFILVM